MKLGISTAALAGGMLVALPVAACGGSPGGTFHATVQGCAAYGVQAIERHITVIRKPAACHDLSTAEVNQAVAVAVVRGPRSIGAAAAGASSQGAGGSGVVSVRARLSPLVVAVHGALAVTTIILVLLAALGGAAN